MYDYLYNIEMFASNYAEVAPYVQENLMPQNEPLPSNHKLSWQMPDPWRRRSKCKEDFVLLAEFSEIEGPKPVLTIPPNVRTDIDINEFCVRLMSVDSQSQPGESFKLHRETSTVLCEHRSGVHGFVHHFTLYDSKARGFVRPFCVAFVTSDKRKVVSWMESLEKEFETVTKLLMDSNLPTFLADMTHYLSDLRYTKAAQHECHNSDTNVDLSKDPILQSVSAESLQTAITEVKLVLRVVSSAIYSPETPTQSPETLIEQAASRTNSICSTKSNGGPSFHYSSSLHVEEQLIPHDDVRDIARGHRRRRSASTSSDSGAYVRHHSNGTQSDTNLLHSGSESEPGGAEGVPNTYSPQFVRTTNKRRYDRTLRNLEELSPNGQKAAVARLHYIRAMYSKSYAELVMEEQDSQQVEPSIGLLTVGANVLINFLPNKSSQDMLHNNELEDAEDDKDDDSDIPEPRGLGSVVFSTSLDNLKAFCENGVLMRKHRTLSREGTENADENSASSENYDGDEADTDAPYDSGLSSDESLRATAQVANSGSSEGEKEEEEENSEASCKPLRVYSITDAVGILNFNTPGLGMLKLSRHFSFTPHLLYSLLIGRPVVVLGNQRKSAIVQEVLRTLLFLVPGANSNSVSLKPLSQPVSQTELEKRLVGVARPCTGPGRHETFVGRDLEGYCTALDMDKRAMYGPSYLGGTLEQVHAARRTHLSDRSYLAFVHSLLSNLSLKAYIFYHTFILNVSSKLPAMYTTPEEASVAYKKAQQHFCASLHTSLHDGDIVRYFAEVIHSQIEGKPLEVEKLSEAKFQLYKS